MRSSTPRAPSCRRAGRPRPGAAGDPDRRRVLRRRRSGEPGRAGGVARRAAQPEAPGAKTLTAITSLAVAVLLGDARGGGGAGRRVAATATRCRDFDRGQFTVLPATVLAMNDPAAAEPRVAAHPRARGAPRVGAGRDRRRPLGRARGASGRATWSARSTARARRWRARRCSAAPATRTWRYSSAFLALAWLERGDRERAWEALRGR